MALTIQQLLNPPTEDQLVATMTTTLQSLGIPADQWKDGGIASTLRRVFARTAAGFASLLVQAVGAGFLPTAAGGWLVNKAASDYGVIAITANFAAGALTLTNSGGGSYSFGAGQAVFLDSSSDVNYTNVTPISLGANATQTIQVQATIPGSAGSAAAGGIDTIVTSMLGVTCTNTLAIVGVDNEADDLLRARCINKLGTLSVRGVRTAYLYAVTSALNGGNPVNINRVSVSANSSTGVVSVYVASPSGVPSAGDIAAAVANIELIARPEAVTVNTAAVTTVTYSPAIVVWVKSAPGLDTASVASAITSALNAYISTFPIGGIAKDVGQGLWASGVDATIGKAGSGIVAGVSGSPVFEVDSVDGTTDQALTAGQVIVFAGTITVRLVTVS